MLNHLVEKAYAVKWGDLNLPFPKDSSGNKIDMTGVTIQNIMDLIKDPIIPIALDVAIIVGVIMIFYSAFLYVSSFGEEAKAETAKKTLLWSIIGTIVVFLAKTIVDIVDKYLG